MNNTKIAGDITQAHDPISLAREMVRKAETRKFIAGFYLLIRKDGTLHFAGCADQRMELVWALERMKLKVLTDE